MEQNAKDSADATTIVKLHLLIFLFFIITSKHQLCNLTDPKLASVSECFGFTFVYFRTSLKIFPLKLLRLMIFTHFDVGTTINVQTKPTDLEKKLSSNFDVKLSSYLLWERRWFSHDQETKVIFHICKGNWKILFFQADAKTCFPGFNIKLITRKTKMTFQRWEPMALILFFHK